MHYSSENFSGKFNKHLEIALTLIGILFTIFATLMLLRLTVFLLEPIVLMWFVLTLIYGHFSYRLIISNGRKLYPLHTLKEFGFEYIGIGRDRYKNLTTNRFMATAEPAAVSLF